MKSLVMETWAGLGEPRRNGVHPGPAISLPGPNGEGKERFLQGQVRYLPQWEEGKSFLFLMMPCSSPTQWEAKVKGEVGRCGPQKSGSQGKEQVGEGLKGHQVVVGVFAGWRRARRAVL